MAVMIYAFPTGSDNKLKNYVFPYVYPYFHQDWSMFVPVPKENFNVYVKQGSGNWYDLFYEINSAHQRNRLAGKEALLFSLANGLRYYAASVKSESRIEEDKDSNINFLVLRKIIINYLKRYDQENSKELQIIIRIRDMGNRVDHSHYYKIKAE